MPLVCHHALQCSRNSLRAIERRVHLQRCRRQIATNALEQPQGKLIFSGIQPTGIPHLGNYLGALRPWVNLQNELPTRCTFSIVDLHALTVPQNASVLSRWRKESFASLMAIGLDPKKSTLFLQSDVSGHSELMWVLSTVASTGLLSRMTQWKSKLGLPESVSMEENEAKAKLRLGLFSYPVLQAADILLYRTTHVPVGEDQIQHIEFARNLAKSFNHLYGNVFVLPEPLLSPAKRIMSLKEPRLKMSKSHADPMSRILITDSTDEIRAKVKAALTDSEPAITYDPEKRPGVSNLLEILKYTSQSPASCEELALDLNGITMRGLKDQVSQAVIDCLAGIREAYLELMVPSNTAVRDAQQRGSLSAKERAESTMELVRKQLGLVEV